MKHLLALYLTLLSFSLSAQNKDIPIIKIYLEDAETAKNIEGAKVTLEGYEIPAITGKYNKKDRYYYFDEIPVGYNTVMAYHNKYNEKGFQNLEGLPKELKLRLYDPLNVSYDFESYIRINKYVEDPYKISISTTDFLEYNNSKDFINQTIKDLQLLIELVNPYWEMNKIENNLYGTSQKEGYPILNLKENQRIKEGYLFPLVGGVSSVFPDRTYSNTSRDICFILRKTDGSKFKRFNDPIIKKLKQQKFKVCSIVLNKKNGRDLTITSNFKIRDEQNKNFNQKNKIDSTKVFFYDNGFRNERKPLGVFNFLKKDHYLQFDEPNRYIQLPSFILISNERNENYNLFSEIGKENPTTYKIPLPSECIGLGILDIYEYYSKAK